MKLLFTFLFAFAAALAAECQTDIDPRLEAKYDAEQLAELSENHPAVIEYWTFYLDNAYYVADAPSGKDLAHLPTVQVADVSDFNVLSLDVHPLEQVENRYVIEGTNKLLVIRSTQKITALYNEYRRTR